METAALEEKCAQERGHLSSPFFAAQQQENWGKSESVGTVSAVQSFRLCLLLCLPTLQFKVIKN